AMTIGNLGVGLGLAFNGYDLWAYVFALLSQNTLMTILYWIYKPVKIGMSWNWETTKDMIRYGGGSTLFNMFNYAATKVDTLIVGKYAQTDFAGADMERWRNTGIYDRSVYLMGLPITVLGKLSDSVMFSGLSQLQDDKARMQRAFLSAVYHIAILVIPGSVFMIFFAEQITVLFLGPKYLDAVPLVQILFATVGFRSVIKIADSIVRAMDRVYTASLIKASFLICVAIGTYFGLKSGLHGVAWALVLAVFIQFVLIMGFSLHLVDLKPNRLIKKFVPAMLISVVVAVASYIAVKINGNISDNQFVKLIVGLSVNTLALGIVAWFAPFVFKQGKDDILDELASRLPVQALKKRWKK
ncbi:MAG: oligosaccharide flippase family protein, partial [Flavobacteriales bacterium]|nr:oligosaccharide flippase family protein [Flavobacteriales bacterium]